MAMHVASRRGGWILMFFRNANAACLNANFTPSPVFMRQTDTPTRFSESELSYKGLVALAFPSVWDGANFFLSSMTRTTSYSICPPFFFFAFLFFSFLFFCFLFFFF